MSRRCERVDSRRVYGAGYGGPGYWEDNNCGLFPDFSRMLRCLFDDRYYLLRLVFIIVTALAIYNFIQSITNGIVVPIVSYFISYTSMNNWCWPLSLGQPSSLSCSPYDQRCQERNLGFSGGTNGAVLTCDTINQMGGNTVNYGKVISAVLTLVTLYVVYMCVRKWWCQRNTRWFDCARRRGRSRSRSFSRSPSHSRSPRRRTVDDLELLPRRRSNARLSQNLPQESRSSKREQGVEKQMGKPKITDMGWGGFPAGPSIQLDNNPNNNSPSEMDQEVEIQNESPSQQS